MVVLKGMLTMYCSTVDLVMWRTSAGRKAVRAAAARAARKAGRRFAQVVAVEGERQRILAILEVM